MKKYFDTVINFKGHFIAIDGYIQDNRVKLSHAYLYATDIEISSGLSSKLYDELTDLILELCTAQ